MRSGTTKDMILRSFASITGVETRGGAVRGTDLKSGIFPFLLGSAATTDAGKRVGIEASLKLSAVYCAVEVLSNSMAMLPVTVEQRSGDNRDTLENHPLLQILNNQVNSYLTSFQFRKIMMRSLLLRGNAYALIVRNEQSGSLERLQYVDPGLVYVSWNEVTDQISYHYRGKDYSPQDIIHLKINSHNGVLGRSIIHYAADSLGVSLNAIEFASSAYGAKGLMMGVIESDKQDISPANKVALANGFRTQMAVRDPYRVAVLDEGMKYKKISITPQEAQFVEAYANGIEDVARWFNVPPHKLMHLTNANYSNILQMDLSFLNSAVLPYVIDLEQEFTFKLLSDLEKFNNTCINFNETALLRMDPKTRGEFLRAMVLSGVWTQNEARVESGKNPVQGVGYDDLLTPVNVQGQEQIIKTLQDE